jgi:HAE1 family hydrophobic/amphiphilic exporter-1
MVPIALGEGPGSASRSSMAKVIVGGQALSLLLTLLVTPVAYSLFDDLSIRRRRGRELAPPISNPSISVASQFEAETVAK